MTDALTYTQRLKLGAIRVRRDLADDARQRAVAAALRNDLRSCEVLHAEADRHEAAIIAAARAMYESPLTAPISTSMPPRTARPRLTTVPAGEPVAPPPSALIEPIDGWNRFVAKLG